jgi:hypothetical protein
MLCSFYSRLFYLIINFLIYVVFELISRQLCCSSVRRLRWTWWYRGRVCVNAATSFRPLLARVSPPTSGPECLKLTTSFTRYTRNHFELLQVKRTFICLFTFVNNLQTATFVARMHTCLLLSQGFRGTAENLARVAYEEHMQKGLTGAVGGVLRQLPPTVLHPVIIATEATSNNGGNVELEYRLVYCRPIGLVLVVNNCASNPMSAFWHVCQQCQLLLRVPALPDTPGHCVRQVTQHT